MAHTEAAVAQVEAILPVGRDGPDPRAAKVVALVREMSVYGKGRDEPMREIAARVGDRWSVLLLLLLEIAPFRHATLRRLACAVSYEGNISQRMMTLRLRTLERDGLVDRSVVPGNRPQVEYRLTPLGQSFLARVHALHQWTRDHWQVIVDAQRRFDEADRESGGR